MSTSTVTEAARIESGRAPGRSRQSGVATLLHRYGYPLLALTRRDLARSYGKTSLGWGWMALQPALLLGLYFIVFGFILRVRVGPDSGPGDFAIYLMSGMLPYMALADGIQRASTSLRENRSLLDQAVFPAEVIPFAGVLGTSFTEVLGLLILTAVAGAFGKPVTLWLTLLPLLILLRIVLTLGVGCLTSVLTVFIPDLREMLSFLLTAWLFLTPIFYSADAAPHVLRLCLELNPLHQLVAAYRTVLFGQPGAGLALVKAGVGSASLLAAGVWFFRRTVTRARDLL